MGISRRIIAALGVAGCVVVTAGLAWACTTTNGSALLNAPSPVRAAASTDVTVTGSGWAPTSQVEIHWDSPTGTLLATVTATASGFLTQQVTVPAGATVGIHSIVAVAGPDLDPKVANMEVEAAGGVVAATPQVVRTGGVAAPAAGVVAGRVSGGRTDPTAAPVGVGVTGQAPALPSPPVPVATQVAASPSPSPSVGGTIGAQPSGRPLTGDLWSGFAGGPGGAPSLVNLPSSHRNGVPGMVAAMAGSGFVALGAGFGLTEARRLRATARVVGS
ncbi:MAG: hypothetical protein ABR511_01515 [Acidimicrobiales bacterium]